MAPIATYAAATASMRDVTKWLVAIVPGAGSVLVATEVVPIATTKGVPGDAVAAVVIAAVAAGLIVWSALQVLQVDHAGWADLRDQLSNEALAEAATNPKTLLYSIEESGLLPLLGFDDVAALADAAGSAAKAKPETRSAVEAVVSYADSWSTQKAFAQFLGCVGISVVVISVCVGWASHISSIDPITKPERVDILNADTDDPRYEGCQHVSDTPLQGVVVEGTWQNPVVILTSPGCNTVQAPIDPGNGVVAPSN